MNFYSFKNSFKSQAGFTLVEMAVVAAIIGLLSTSLILNFSRKRLDLTRSVNLLTSNLRSAQNSAISSAKFQGYNPCGYGFHYVDAFHFAIYAGPNAATTTCSGTNRNYLAGEDTITQTFQFGDSNVQFDSSFNDIYFEPPDPKTYLNNSADLSQSPISIIIKATGGTCPADCKTINVYPSGNIETP